MALKLKKRHLVYLILVAFISCPVMDLLFDKITLSNPNRIEKETGLILPQGVQVVATEMNIFSLADGKNYGWLLVSDHDMRYWIEKNMSLEGGPNFPSGGWAEIKAFGEISKLAQDDIAGLKFSGVWKSVHQTSNGKIETTYLYVAEGNRVAQLHTFHL